MGRYLESKQFFDFMDSDVMDCPRIFLEMSSASKPEVYRRFLQREDLWDRLLFGSDMPYGLLTGEEYWSEDTGPMFITRDKYIWSDPLVTQKFSKMRKNLTYNTYHTINALKKAIDDLGLLAEDYERLKRKIFAENARDGLFEKRL